MTGNISPWGGPAVAVRVPLGGASVALNWLRCIQSGTRCPSARGPPTGGFLPLLRAAGALGTPRCRYCGCLAACSPQTSHQVGGGVERGWQGGGGVAGDELAICDLQHALANIF